MSLFVRFNLCFSSFYSPKTIYKEEASENIQKIYDRNSQVFRLSYLFVKVWNYYWEVSTEWTSAF